MKVSNFYKNIQVYGLIAGALSITLFGCMTDNASKKESVTITGFKVNPVSIRAGDSVDVEGMVSSTMGLTAIKISIWKGAEDVSIGKGFEISQKGLGGTIKGWSLKTDDHTKIHVGGLTALGDYTVRVVARSGDDSAVATSNLKVDGTLVVTTEIILGSNQNALGGSVDLDNMTTYTHVDAKAISGKIDLYYANSLLNEDKLFSPLQAKISGFGSASNGPATWSVANATEFRNLTMAASTFAAISTQESIDALWDGGILVKDGSDVVSEGSTYIVNTDMAKKVLIRVTALLAGDTGMITVKGTK